MSFLGVEELRVARGLYLAKFSGAGVSSSSSSAADAEILQVKAALASSPSPGALLSGLEAVLASRTFLAGYSFSDADSAALAG